MLIAGGGPAGMMLRIRSPPQKVTRRAAALASGSRATRRKLWRRAALHLCPEPFRRKFSEAYNKRVLEELAVRS
jgi:hypothetical protein